MQNNIFLGSDPLLGSSTYQAPNFDERIAQLKQMQDDLEKQKQMMSHPQNVQAQSKSPVWDEIDKVTSDLSDRDFSYISENEEFQKSNNAIMAILHREYMRVMRPIVEGTKDGKEALENHLQLVKKLKKESERESSRNMDLFNEYTENYSDMTFDDFMKMKREKSKAKTTKK